jgi:hypothetical protein
LGTSYPFSILLLFGLITGGSAAPLKSVFAPDYFPVDRKTYCRRTFDFTVGLPGQSHSEIIGRSTVPYLSGPLTGTMVCALSPGEYDLSTWSNDGITLKPLMDNDHFASTDDKLTAFPPEAAFGRIQDREYKLPVSPPYFAIKKGLTFSYISGDADDVLWFRIQDVTVRGKTHRDALIMWEMDSRPPGFSPLQPHAKYAEFGITPPTADEALGKQVTGFIVFAEGVGIVAVGGIKNGELVAAAELVSISCNDKAPAYDAFDVPGTRITRAQGGNENGDIVGEYQWNTGQPTHGFLRNKHGELTTIDFPGAIYTSARDINDRGQIVGTYRGSDNLPHGFVLDKGVFTRIDFPGAPTTQAFGINSRGDVVGAYSNSPTKVHGFLLRDGVFTTIDYPGAVRTEPQGISESGEVVGRYATAPGGNAVTRGFLLSNGMFTEIDFPGARSTDVRGINAAGDIVGTYSTLLTDPPMPVTRGFVWSKGFFQTVEAPCSFQTALSDINNQGDLIGEFLDQQYLEVQLPFFPQPRGAWYGFRVSRK